LRLAKIFEFAKGSDLPLGSTRWRLNPSDGTFQVCHHRSAAARTVAKWVAAIPKCQPDILAHVTAGSQDDPLSISSFAFAWCRRRSIRPSLFESVASATDAQGAPAHTFGNGLTPPSFTSEMA
jgi:hypothetical protein